jgi:O-antigen/teichoic acid export membrane protein
MKRRIGVGSQTVMLVAATAISQSITAFLFIATARLSAVELFGQVATAVAIGMVGAGLVDFGFNSLYTRDLAANSVRLDEYWSRAKTKLSIGFLLAAIWFFSTFAISFVLSIASLVFFSILTLQTLLVPLRAQSRITLVAVLFLVERVSAALLFVTLILIEHSPSMSLILSLAFGTLISSLIAWILVGRLLESPKVRAHRGLPWAGSKNYGVSAISNSLQQLDLPLLALFGGPAVAGIYGSISKWTQPLGLIANAFATASTPVIAKVSSTREAIRQVSRSAWIIALGLLAAVAMIPLAPWLVDLLLGSGYAAAVPVFQLMALGTIPGILNQILASGLQARGFDRQVARIGFTAVFIQLALVVAFSGDLGAVAAAAAYCVLQTFALALLSLLLNSKMKSEISQ